MMRTASDMEVLGDYIHESYLAIIKDARSQEELDEIWGSTMEWISENFVVVYLGEPMQDSEVNPE